MIKKIYFFDFDATLFDTLNPEKGKEIYKKETGKEYPHKGWWSKTESLDNNIFNFKSYKPIVDKLKKANNESDSLTVLLSSRLGRLEPQIKKILKTNNIHVDEISLKNTNSIKTARIKDYLEKYKDVKDIYIYDDREVELENLIELHDELDINVKVYKATNGKLKLVEDYNNENDIIKEIISEQINKFFLNH